MKLPECHRPIARHQLFSAKEVEAIVRDCAKIAGDRAKRENDGYDRNGHEKAILARYGLEPKT